MDKNRIKGIDGLKGIAILAVVFTHIPLNVWYKFIPQFLQPIFSFLIQSGGVGVNLFFITTGFLMGFLYPAPISAFDFYTRRYARLFPAFLVMVASFTIFRLILFWDYTILEIFVVLIFAFIANKIFKKIFSLENILWFGKKPIFWFLSFQGLVALWYMFYLLKVPSSVFYIRWPKTLQYFITLIVNATLTLPFGKYVGQLDGIYWAICAEMLFYLLYPVLIAPLIQGISKTSKWLKTLIGVTLFPFCFGLMLLSTRVLGFAMLNFHLFIYFFIGVYIGVNFINIKKIFLKYFSILTNEISLLVILLMVFSTVYIDNFLSQNLRIWLTMGMVIPVSILIIAITSRGTNKQNFLELPIFIFLGKYSYAVFLIHSLIIQIVSYYIPANNTVNSILFTLLVLGGSIVSAYVLYQLTGKAYFTSRKKDSNNKIKLINFSSSIIHQRTLYLLTSLLIISYLGFRTPLAFFTQIVHHGKSSIFSVFDKNEITLSDKSFRQSFVAQENNLGMITTHLKKDKVSGITGGFVPFLLNIRLFDENNQIKSQSSYQAYQMLDDWYHPFGFPIENNSKGKTYTVEYQLSENSPSEEIKLVSNEGSMLSVYFMDKKQIFTHPKILFFWGINKLSEPLKNPMYWVILLLITPFLGLNYLVNRKKSL